MIITLSSWIIILFLAISIGSVFIDFIAADAFAEISKIDVYIVAGVMCLNVYAQIYSIFSNVGETAFCLIFVVAGVCTLYQFAIAKKYISKSILEIPIWQFCVLLVVTMLVGLYTLKAPNHIDTYLYHAQAIRWIEEYRVVPGLGNLHNRFAYNSACMPLHALFSFNWLLEQPLHAVNGFLGCFFISYALITNKLFTKSESRLSDFLKLVIIIYVYVNRDHISSPGSDIPAMLLVIYIMCKWSECSESRGGVCQSFGVICLFAAWAVSVKLSAVTCMILVLYSAITLIIEKRWKTILVDLISGIVIVAPWLVRNVIISGYILYPYSGIDVFNFDWKMPVEMLDYDRKEIMVWGRAVKDVSRFDESIMQWFGTWYNGQMLRDRMFIILGFLATFVLIILILVKLMGKFGNRYDIKIFLSDISEWFLIITMVASEVFWLFSAPLLRYGSVYLLMPIAVVIFILKEFMGESRFRRWAMMGTVFILSLNLLRKDEDFRLVRPHGYRKMYNVMNEWYGFEIYSPLEDTLSGYDDFPAVTRKDVLENIVPRGNKLEDGFKVK